MRDVYSQRDVNSRTRGPAVTSAGDGLEGVYSGVLHTVPSAGACKVLIPAFSLTSYYTAKVPAPYSGVIGDAVLVAFDEQKQPWLVVPSALLGEQPGDLVPSAATSRAGCLPCDGTTGLLRVTYPALYANIDPAYHIDADHFKVPDLRGRAPVGAGTGSGLSARTIGGTGGEETHTLASGEMPVHNHSGTTGTDSPDHSHSGTTGNTNTSLEHTHGIFVSASGIATTTVTAGNGTATGTMTSSSNSPSMNHTHNVTTGGASARHAHSIVNDGSGGAHNNMQPFAVVNWFIKT